MNLIKSACSIILIILFVVGLFGFKGSGKVDEKLDVTFFVASDLHFDPPPETDQYYHVVAMNAVCGTFEKKPALIWPDKISGAKTNFGSAGQNINVPRGVVLTGDITDRADPAAVELFKKKYEMGYALRQIHFPVYIGLGNHDLDPQHVDEHKEEYRKQMLNYVSMRHRGKDAPVPADNFDDKSYNYSWNWGNLHLIQTQRFAGNTENGHINSLAWLKDDLKKYASDGRPVIIFQHYGFDKFSLKWWADAERDTLRKVLDGYNIVGIFVGHNHFAENREWNGIPVFQVNNGWKDEDGNGSFAVCHITEDYIDVVTAKWLDGEGNVELVSPVYTKKFNRN